MRTVIRLLALLALLALQACSENLPTAPESQAVPSQQTDIGNTTHGGEDPPPPPPGNGGGWS